MFEVRQRWSALKAEGLEGKSRMSRSGQLYTLDWKTELVHGGFVFGVSPIAAAIAGGDETGVQITGGGAGTVIDSDQPELIVGVDSGHVLCPMKIVFAGKVDIDADAEIGAFLAFMDRTQGPPSTVTGTVATVNNYLGEWVSATAQGGPGFPGRAFHTITADITDPVMTDLLAYEVVRGADAGAAASEQVVQLRAEYIAQEPMWIDGPCSLVCCWGGTAAVTGLVRITFACVPKERLR